MIDPETILALKSSVLFLGICWGIAIPFAVFAGSILKKESAWVDKYIFYKEKLFEREQMMHGLMRNQSDYFREEVFKRVKKAVSNKK